MSTKSSITVRKNEIFIYSHSRGTQTDATIFDYQKHDYVVIPYFHYIDLLHSHYDKPSVIATDKIIKKKKHNIIESPRTASSPLSSSLPSSSADHNDLFEKINLRPRPPPKIKRLQRAKKEKKNKENQLSAPSPPPSPPPAYDCSVALVSLPSTPAPLPTPSPPPTQKNNEQLSFIRAFLADINNIQMKSNDNSYSFLDIELD